MAAPNVLRLRGSLIWFCLGLLFSQSVVPLFSMPIMYMFDTDQSLFIKPGNPRTSPLSGNQKVPTKPRTLTPGDQTGGWGQRWPSQCKVCKQLLSLLCGQWTNPYMPPQELGCLAVLSHYYFLAVTCHFTVGM